MKGKRGDSRVAKLIAGENRPEPLSRASGKSGSGSMIPGRSGRSNLGRSKSDAPTIIINIGNSDEDVLGAQKRGEVQGGMMGAALQQLKEQEAMPPMPPMPAGPMPAAAPAPVPPGPPMPGIAPQMPMPQPGPAPGLMPPMKRGGRYT